MGDLLIGFRTKCWSFIGGCSDSSIYMSVIQTIKQVSQKINKTQWLHVFQTKTVLQCAQP